MVNKHTRSTSLPVEIASHQYCIDPLLKLGQYNYKLNADVGFSDGTWARALTVLDTGAAPNLIRADLVPIKALAQTHKPNELINLASASGHKIDVLGTINVKVRVGSMVHKHEFIVSRQLHADVLLGCQFIDKSVQSIHTQARTIELVNGDTVPIYRQQSKGLTPCPPSDQKYIHHQTARARHPVRLSKPITLEPWTTSVTQAVTRTHGLVAIDPLPNLLRKHRCSIPYGIAQVRPNVQFYIQISNLSDTPVSLPKGTSVGMCNTTLDANTILTLDAEPKLTKEDRATAHLAQKKQQRKARPVPASEVPLPDLDDNQKRQAQAVLEKFEHMWHPDYNGKCNITEHRIDIEPGARPQYSQPYRAGPQARQVIQDTIDDMLEKDIIEPSKSAWAAPVVLAPKANGTLRFCVDFRRLNAVTIKDRYPLPRMEDCLDSLTTARYFSTLDCTWGFWQIPLAAKDRHKAAFTTHAGTFQYKRMPFGLCNAPATFQRTLDILLSGLKWSTCLVYVDDVIIFSDDFQSHLAHVHQVLNIIREAGLALNIAKCNFFRNSVDYLGHVVLPGRLKVARRNTAAISKATFPHTQTELRSFLGMCNVYRRFVPRFSAVAEPLNRLLVKGQPTKLPPPTEEMKNAFDLLKRALTNPPVLQLPDVTKRLSLETDASSYQIGCSLMQAGNDDVRYPIGFWSRTLTPAERNYSATEREALAIVWSVGLLYPYVWGRHFTIFTDHQALQWIFNLEDPTGRLSRWRMRLQELDFTVKYKKGKENVVADCISRLPTFGYSTVDVDTELPVFAINAENELATHHCDKVDTSTWIANDWELDDPRESTKPDSFIWQDPWEIFALREPKVDLITTEELISEQRNDPEVNKILKAKADGSPTYQNFFINSTGLLIRKSPRDGAEQIFIPKNLRARALYLSHYTRTAGHPGVSRQYYTMRQSMYWPSMMLDIQKQSRNCCDCGRERVKLRKHQAPLKLFPASSPLEYVAIDILGPLPKAKSGDRFILVITDRFSKFTRAVPMKTISALNVCKIFLDHWVFAYGAPTHVLSDNGSQFASKLFQFVCSSLGVRNVFTTTYHPQTNGQAERFNRTLLHGLRVFAGEHPETWPEFVGTFAYAYNTQVHSSTKIAPFQLVVTNPPGPLIMRRMPGPQGKTPPRRRQALLRAHLQALIQKGRTHLASAQQAYKRNFDARVKPLTPVRTGDYIFLARVGPQPDDSAATRQRHKLQRRADGPFQVIADSPNTVTIDKGDLVEVVSRDRVTRAPDPATNPDAPATADDDPVSSRTRKRTSSRTTSTSAPKAKPNANEHVLDKVVDHNTASDMFRCRWYNHPSDDDTWEPPTHIPYAKVKGYFTRKKTRPPDRYKRLCRPC